MDARLIAAEKALGLARPSPTIRWGRPSLLVGTALASTLLLLSAGPSLAASCAQPASPAPIKVAGATTPVSCDNTLPRTASAPGDNAIDISTTGAGNTVTITNSGALTTTAGSFVPGPLLGVPWKLSTGGKGIFAVTNGIGADITVNNSGAINSSSNAIDITDTPMTGTIISGDGHLSVNNSGAIVTGGDAEGIVVHAVYGANNVITVVNSGAITTGPSTDTYGSSTAIFADVGSNNGSVSVTNSGAITTSGDTAAGISAVANYYSGTTHGTIVIDNRAGGNITTTGADSFGIFATAGSYSNVDSPDNFGTVTISNAATINSGYAAIGAYSYGQGGDITITNSGALTGGSYGIVTATNIPGSAITITNNGKITGGQAGAKITSAGPAAATLNIGSAGSIGATNNLAIWSTNGGLLINDGGLITGRVALSDAADTLNIVAGGTFKALTDSDFGGGGDVLNNQGVLDASGSGNVPQAVALNGLTSFVNGSTGSGLGLITLVDGQAGDSLTTSGNFIGQGNSTLAVDADVSSAGVADTLVINGNASGHTAVAVNVTNIGNGAPNYTGVPIALVSGTTAEADFALAKGPVNAGLFAYDLFLDGHAHVLRAVGLGNAAYELPAGVNGAQTTWQDTADGLQSYFTAQRDNGSSVGPGTVSSWVQAFGGSSAVDPSRTFADPVSGRPETLDLDTTQNSSGLIGGVDVGLGEMADGNVRLGVMAGYVSSALDFDATDDSWSYKGLAVAAYATYTNRSGFYLNGVVQADRLDVAIADNQTGVHGSASSVATSVGARVDAGYRIDTDWGFVEPEVSLEGANTSMSDIALFGANVSFGQGNSGRARAALRLGTTMQRGDATITPDLTLSVWNQLGGSNSVTLSGIPGVATTTTTNDPGSSLFASVAAGVNVAGTQGWSGSIHAAYNFSATTRSGSIGAGLHHSW